MPQDRRKSGFSSIEINIEAWALKRKSPKVKRVQDDGVDDLDLDLSRMRLDSIVIARSVATRQSSVCYSAWIAALRSQ
jgi:hypothetical protein